MCDYQTLFHHAKIGYAVRCPKCDRIQIAFASLAMTFNPEDFFAFAAWAKKIRQQQGPVTDPTLRCLIIPSPCPEVRLLLSAGELEELCLLLDTADTELMTHQLLELFEPPGKAPF